METVESVDTTGISDEMQPAPSASSTLQSRTVPVPTGLDIPRFSASNVRLPLPVMSEANIDGYFMSLEFWFKASQIADDVQKFYIVTSQIPAHKLIYLRNIIDNVPVAGKYAYIKDHLMSEYTDSQQRRLKRVLSEMPLGEQRPSSFYSSMARIAEGALSESALVDLWASRLPENIHAAIAASDGSLAVKLKIADAIFNSLDLRSNAAINEVKKQPEAQPSGCHPEVLDLVQMIGALLRDSRSKSSGTNNRQPPNTGPHSASNPNSSARRKLEYAEHLPTHQAANKRQSRSQETRPAEIEDWDAPPASDNRPLKILTERRRSASIERFEHCWYHRTYQQAATTCRPPCATQD